MSKSIPAKYDGIITILRDTLVECGGKPLYQPEDFGLNEYFKSGSDDTLLVFDYGNPGELLTPEGMITPYGSCICASDTGKFYRLLEERLKLTIVTPQRNDVETRKRSELEFQLSKSGPVCKINL